MGENELVGQSAAMRDVRRLIDIAAPTKTTILIQGATGTGKELVARSIHKNSSRRGEMISINCSAIQSMVSIKHDSGWTPFDMGTPMDFIWTIVVGFIRFVIGWCVR